MTTRYQGIERDENKAVVPGAKIYVLDRTGATLQTLTDDYGNSLANPVASDSLGGYYFNVADPGTYYLKHRYNGRLQLLEFVAVGISSDAVFKGDQGAQGITGSVGRAGPATYAQSKAVNRPPYPTDDTSKGHSIGDLWSDTSGRIWMASSITTGYAAWSQTDVSNVPLENDALPLDRVGSATLAFAPFKLRAAYAGNCFRVKRGSDNTTLDIGFVYDGERKLYVADWAAVDKFGAGTTLWYNILYDQSGNANDITEDATYKVYINSADSNAINDINGLRTITFWGGASQRMVIPVGHSVSRQAHTIISAGLVESSGHNNGYCELGNDATYSNRNIMTTNVRDGRLVPIGDVTLIGPRIESGPSIMGASFGTTTANYMCNDTASTSGAFGAFTLAGGFIGAGNSNNATYWGDYGAFIVYGSALSTANMQILRQSLTRILRIQPQCRDRLVINGDSISVGADTPAQPWWRQAFANFDRDFQVFNNALEGDTAADGLTHYANAAGNVYVAGRRNILVNAYGTNDLAGLDVANGAAANATTVYNRLVSYCALGKATGYTVLLATLLPRNNSFAGGQTHAGFEAARLLLNAMIRAGNASYDGVIDYGGDPYIGQDANVGDATLFNGSLHPKQRGHAYMAAYAAAAINAVG